MAAEDDEEIDVAKQVEATKKQLDTWPDWMKKASRFEGSNMSDSFCELWTSCKACSNESSGGRQGRLFAMGSGQEK